VAHRAMRGNILQGADSREFELEDELSQSRQLTAKNFSLHRQYQGSSLRKLSASSGHA
jgi:hypothetical protein